MRRKETTTWKNPSQLVPLFPGPRQYYKQWNGAGNELVSHSVLTPLSSMISILCPSVLCPTNFNPFSSSSFTYFGLTSYLCLCRSSTWSFLPYNFPAEESAPSWSYSHTSLVPRPISTDWEQGWYTHKCSRPSLQHQVSTLSDTEKVQVFVNSRSSCPPQKALAW